MIIRNAMLLAASGLALASCAANPGPVIDTSTKKLISYFDAKKELASTLQQQLGGPTGQTAGENVSYRLVALNGPAYQLGSVLSARNALDLMTRRCALSDNELPVEPWSTMPRWSSNSNLDTDLGIPAPFQGVFNQTSVDAGLSFQSASIYAIEDISQRFLARDELQMLTQNGECGAFFSDLQEPVLFVRGIVYGRETLKSAKGFAAGLNVRVIEEESGQFTFKYDRNGAYELTDTDVMPKFAIIAKFVPRPQIAAVTRPEPPRTTNRVRVEGERRPASIPDRDGEMSASIEEFDPNSLPPTAAGSVTAPPLISQPLTDEEVAKIEKMLAGGGN